MLAGFLHLGFVADFISRPVLTGSKIGMGVAIAVRQLGNVLGVPVSGDSVFGEAASALRQLPEASPPVVILAAATVVLLLVLRRTAPRVPGPLVALAAGILAVAVFGLPNVPTVADVPRGLPVPWLPDPRLVLPVLPDATGIAIKSIALASMHHDPLLSPLDRKPFCQQPPLP